MFFDWLSCYQDFEQDLPVISKTGYAFFETSTGETLEESAYNISNVQQTALQHEGSFSTHIKIKVSGRRITMTGNPSRWGRLDNLFGYQSLDQCFLVYNNILASLGLPGFTKCIQHGFRQEELANGAIRLIPVVSGAHITELHITTNVAVGKGNTDAYLRAVASLPYRNSVPHIYPNGKTVDWKSKLDNARLIYPSYYEKLNELELKSIPKIKKQFGEESTEYQYIAQLCDYLRETGVIRCEQKLKSTYLNKHNMQFWGISDYSPLTQLQNEFLNIDNKLKVSAMDIETITETLLNQKIVESTRAANITALVAYNWMQGRTFDFSKSQNKIHRARLRHIGIDIARPCNIVLFSPIIIKEVREITKQCLVIPSFYSKPQNHLRLVA